MLRCPIFLFLFIFIFNIQDMLENISILALDHCLVFWVSQGAVKQAQLDLCWIL